MITPSSRYLLQNSRRYYSSGPSCCSATRTTTNPLLLSAATRSRSAPSRSPSATSTPSVLSARRQFSATFQPRSNHSGSSSNKSRHAQFYSDLLPAMIPVFLLGSTIFLGLQLTQLTLSHEKFIQESEQRVRELEREIEALQARKERENAGGSMSPSNSSAEPSSSVQAGTKGGKSWWAFW
ncbi:hypothetical protein CPC08DRAFT_701994 [Agrocybe pediades]|nr:hypothetical protein CPC08DRAFT_701994 [Agrocybe pediades]